MMDPLEQVIIKVLVGPMQSGDFDPAVLDQIAALTSEDGTISKAYGKAHKSRAAKLALARAGDMIAGIDTVKQQTIQLLVARSISESWTQHQLYARLKETVGLAPRHARAVENLRAGLRAKGMTPSKADARARAYANRLLRQRARLIATHERKMALERAKTDGWLRDQQDGKINPGAMRKNVAQRGCCDQCRQEDGNTYPLSEYGHVPPFHPNCRCQSVLVGADTPWETVQVTQEPINKGIVVTPGGRIGNDSPFSRSKTSNWVARAGGLPKYIRVVARGLMKDGRSEARAIAMAIGIVKNWASGKGNVSPKVRAAAAKAVAEWEAKRAKSHADNVKKIDSGLLAPDMTDETVRAFLATLNVDDDTVEFKQFVRTPDGQVTTRSHWGRYKGQTEVAGRLYVRLVIGYGDNKETIVIPARRIIYPDRIERVVADPEGIE